MFNKIWFDADGGDGGNGNGDGKKPEDKADKTFTQTDVDRIVGERAKRAEESAVSELLKALGFEKVDDLKTTVTDAKKLREQQMSDLDKAKAESTALQLKVTAAEQARAEAIEKATVTLMRAAVLTEASKPEYRFKPDALADVWSFIDRTSIKPKEGADGEFVGVAEALKSLAKAKAYLTETGDGHGTPRPGARGKSGKEDLGKDAQEQARRTTRNNF